jgi:hypothetical protein
MYLETKKILPLRWLGKNTCQPPQQTATTHTAERYGQGKKNRSIQDSIKI